MPAMRPIAATLLLSLAALTSAPLPAAAAQSSAAPLTPLDQFFEDADPLAASLRLRFTDPRLPVGFQQVYRGPDDLLMRVDGAVVALFPRSVYALGRRGVVPLVPPGTVFHIGASPEQLLERDAAQPRSSPSLLQGRLPPRLASEQTTAAQPPRSTTLRAGLRVTVWSDERYRRRRLRSLLLEALQSQLAGKGAP